MIMMLLMRGNPSSYEERIQCYQIRCPWVQTTTTHCTPGKHVITTRHTSLTTDWPPRSPSLMYSSDSNIDISINFRWSYLLMSFNWRLAIIIINNDVHISCTFSYKVILTLRSSPIETHLIHVGGCLATFNIFRQQSSPLRHLLTIWHFAHVSPARSERRVTRWWMGQFTRTRQLFIVEIRKWSKVWFPFTLFEMPIWFRTNANGGHRSPSSSWSWNG